MSEVKQIKFRTAFESVAYQTILAVSEEGDIYMLVKKREVEGTIIDGVKGPLKKISAYWKKCPGITTAVVEETR